MKAPQIRSRLAGPRFVSADEVAHGLSMVDAVDALESTFATLDDLAAPVRTQLPFGDGTLLVMPATRTAAEHTPIGGVKVVTVRAANTAAGSPSVQALYLLFGGETLSLTALIEGTALTDLRTGAVSALVARRLALPGAHRLVLFGAGAQARAHLRALCAIRPVDDVVVVGRDPGAQPDSGRARALVDLARGMGLSARLGTPDAVADADLVCTCTTSPRPLFDGTLLRPGVHVTAVGAYQPHTRELDDTAVTRGRLVVEDRAAALAEAGELCLPIAAGLIDESAIVADLHELCQGIQVRRSDHDVTVFKSVGLAVEDLVVADALVRALDGGG